MNCVNALSWVYNISTMSLRNYVENFVKFKKITC